MSNLLLIKPNEEKSTNSLFRNNVQIRDFKGTKKSKVSFWGGGEVCLEIFLFEKKMWEFPPEKKTENFVCNQYRLILPGGGGIFS